MVRFEYNEVLKTIGINIMKEEIDLQFTKEKVYSWHNLDIYYNNFTDVIVKGFIPIDVINIINQKNKDNRYNIYEKEDYFSINTKEGLILLLTEIDNYINNKNTDYNELIVQANQEELRMFNPNISANEWMKDNNSYNETINNDSKQQEWFKLRHSLLLFDKAINPYLNNEVSFNEMIDYLDKLRIEICKYYPNDDGRRELCGYLKIKLLDNINETKYIRNEDGFEFSILFQNNNGSYIKISHCYSKLHNTDTGDEFIIFTKVNNNDSRLNDIQYLNITKRQLTTKYDEVFDLTPEQLRDIIIKITEDIHNYTEYANNITCNNMIKNNKIKRLNNLI